MAKQLFRLNVYQLFLILIIIPIFSLACNENIAGGIECNSLNDARSYLADNPQAKVTLPNGDTVQGITIGADGRYSCTAKCNINDRTFDSIKGYKTNSDGTWDADEYTIGTVKYEGAVQCRSATECGTVQRFGIPEGSPGTNWELKENEGVIIDPDGVRYEITDPYGSARRQGQTQRQNEKPQEEQDSNTPQTGNAENPTGLSIVNDDDAGSEQDSESSTEQGGVETAQRPGFSNNRPTGGVRYMFDSVGQADVAQNRVQNANNVRITSNSVTTVDSAGRITIGSNTEANNVISGTVYPFGYYNFQYTESINTPVYSAIEVYNLNSLGSSLMVGSAQRFEIESAEQLTFGNITFNDIGLSFFVIEDNFLTYANIVSAVDNNTFYLGAGKIILDSGEQFEATFKKDGTIIIETEDPASISADEEIVITLTNLIDPARKIANESNRSTITQQVGKSVIEIDSELGIIAIHLAPTSRYISYTNNSNARPFSLYVPPYMEFDFYLKKHPDQNIPVNISKCSQCGLIDYSKNIIYLNGMIEYERLNSDGGFVNIIVSRTTDNKIELYLDSSMDKITNLIFTGSLAHFFSGVFEVKSELGTFYYNYHEFNALPYIIKAIQPNIKISNQGTLTRTQPDNTFIMYELGSEPGMDYLEKLNKLDEMADSIRLKYDELMEKYINLLGFS